MKLRQNAAASPFIDTILKPCYPVHVVHHRVCTVDTPAFANTKEGGERMSNGDLLSLLGFIASVASLLISVYMLGRKQ